MTQRLLLVRPWDYAPGTVIRVSHGIYDHLALLGEYAIGGERAVLSFSSRAGGLARGAAWKLPVESPQLRQWMTLGGIIGVFALAARA